MAAATAVGAATNGERVLLVSLDRAHGLADVLDRTIAPENRRAWHPDWTSSRSTRWRCS
ncbi:hypothetical protein GS531_11955, partial [Rhodococcus hoagii]|nr:hypothetical protein [Prescottella equi]